MDFQAKFDENSPKNDGNLLTKNCAEVIFQMEKSTQKNYINLWTKNGAEVTFIWGNLHKKSDGF